MLPYVAPRAGAWIETAYFFRRYLFPLKSRPARARGLKLLEIILAQRAVKVAPRAGAWIETECEYVLRQWRRGRAPRGRVD